MKSTSIVILALVSLVTASQGQNSATSGQRPPMRSAPTQEELVMKLRKSEQEMAAAAASLPASSTKDPREGQPVPDLFEMSSILCYNGAFTLVPKRAVLQFPQNLKDRLKAQPGSKVQNWLDFYTANRNWITTVEVSKSQASGASSLPEETTTHMAKCGKVVVATLQGNPVSVHPVPPPAPSPTASTNHSPASKP